MKLPKALKEYLLQKFSFPFYPNEKIPEFIIDFDTAVDHRAEIAFNGILVDRKYQIVLPEIPFPSTHEAVALLLGKAHFEGIPDSNDQLASFETDIFEYINGERRSDRWNNDYARAFFRTGYFVVRNDYRIVRYECSACICSADYRFDISDQLLLKAIGCDRYIHVAH
jgi:hypothetical protein